MSPIAQVESRYDGHIPPAELAAAFEANRTYVAPSLPLRPRKRPPVTAAEIARILVDRTAAAGACTEADLAAAGFTVEEITRLGEAARLIARRSGLEG